MKLERKMDSNSEGYFYKFQNGKVKLIKYLLDENGFQDFSLFSQKMDEKNEIEGNIFSSYIYIEIYSCEKKSFFFESKYIVNKKRRTRKQNTRWNYRGLFERRVT